MELTLVKELNGSFKPAYDSDYEQAKKIKAGKQVHCEITQPRNYEFLKKFFALVNLVYQNQDKYTNIKHLRKDLIIEAGYYDVRYNLHGVEIFEAKSISFASMTEDEFGKLYNAVVDTIVKYFHFDKQEIIDNVSQYF